MLKLLRRLVPFCLLLVLPACWVRLPVVPGDGVEGRGGEIRVLERDIQLIRIPGGRYNAWEIRDPKNLDGEVLKKGSRLRVGKAVKRILEPGPEYYYDCVDLESGRKIDLPLTLRDAIGLPHYSKWASHGGEGE